MASNVAVSACFLIALLAVSTAAHSRSKVPPSEEPAHAVVARIERIPAKDRPVAMERSLARAYHTQGRLDAAAAAADSALKRDARDADAWLVKGDVLRERGDWGGALAAFKQAAALRPQDVDVQLRIGQAYQELGRTNEADAAFDRYSQSFKLR